jgi:hypothetical protein
LQRGPPGVPFTAGALEAAADPYGSGPGGPILVVRSETNAFSTYYAEILLNEGLNEFALTNVSAIDPAVLSNYDVVILGERVDGGGGRPEHR